MASSDISPSPVDPGAVIHPTSAPDPNTEWIAIGRIMGVFGPRGDLRVQPLSRFPQRFRELRTVYVGEEHTPATILHRREHGLGLVLRLENVTTHEEARALHGQYLYVPEKEAVQLPEGEYFVHQIVGLKAVSTTGEELGSVADVLATGSNDVYVLRGARGEILLPAIKDVIKKVDLETGTMTVEVIPGLLD